MLDWGDFMLKKIDKNNTENITFINMPIASTAEDKIGVTQELRLVQRSQKI